MRHWYAEPILVAGAAPARYRYNCGVACGLREGISDGVPPLHGACVNVNTTDATAVRV
jgi:hypothetical protein